MLVNVPLYNMMEYLYESGLGGDKTEPKLEEPEHGALMARAEKKVSMEDSSKIHPRPFV
jgi:hypothetical protein